MPRGKKSQIAVRPFTAYLPSTGLILKIERGLSFKVTLEGARELWEFLQGKAPVLPLFVDEFNAWAHLEEEGRFYYVKIRTSDMQAQPLTDTLEGRLSVLKRFFFIIIRERQTPS